MNIWKWKWQKNLKFWIIINNLLLCSKSFHIDSGSRYFRLAFRDLVSKISDLLSETCFIWELSSKLVLKPAIWNLQYLARKLLPFATIVRLAIFIISINIFQPSLKLMLNLSRSQPRNMLRWCLEVKTTGDPSYN